MANDKIDELTKKLPIKRTITKTKKANECNKLQMTFSEYQGDESIDKLGKEELTDSNDKQMSGTGVNSPFKESKDANIQTTEPSKMDKGIQAIPRSSTRSILLNSVSQITQVRSPGQDQDDS